MADRPAAVSLEEVEKCHEHLMRFQREFSRVDVRLQRCEQAEQTEGVKVLRRRLETRIALLRELVLEARARHDRVRQRWEWALADWRGRGLEWGLGIMSMLCLLSIPPRVVDLLDRLDMLQQPLAMPISSRQCPNPYPVMTLLCEILWMLRGDVAPAGGSR